MMVYSLQGKSSKRAVKQRWPLYSNGQPWGSQHWCRTCTLLAKGELGKMGKLPRMGKLPCQEIKWKAAPDCRAVVWGLSHGCASKMKVLSNGPLWDGTLLMPVFTFLFPGLHNRQPLTTFVALFLSPLSTFRPGGCQLDFWSLPFVSTAVCSAFCRDGGNLHLSPGREG